MSSSFNPRTVTGTKTDRIEWPAPGQTIAYWHDGRMYSHDDGPSSSQSSSQSSSSQPSSQPSSNQPSGQPPSGQPSSQPPQGSQGSQGPPWDTGLDFSTNPNNDLSQNGK